MQRGHSLRGHHHGPHGRRLRRDRLQVRGLKDPSTERLLFFVTSVVGVGDCFSEINLNLYSQYGQLDARQRGEGRAGGAAAGARDRGRHPGAGLQVLRQGAGYGTIADITEWS